VPLTEPARSHEDKIIVEAGKVTLLTEDIKRKKEQNRGDGG